MDRRIELWLHQHGGHERRFADTVARFFDRQLNRFLAALEQIPTPTPNVVPHLFHVDEESRAFMRAVRPFWISAALIGAESEQKLLRDASDEKAARRNPLPRPRVHRKLPPTVVDAIDTFWEDTERQSYWQDIQDGTSKSLTKLINRSIVAGDDPRKMAKKIRDAMGGDFSKARAAAIARTETTGAMNSGHQAQIEEVAESGAIKGKTWKTMEDPNVRLTHRILHNKTVKPEAQFLVGGNGRDRGWPAMFPGDWRLPPEERVNCRCTIVAVTIFEQIPRWRPSPALLAENEERLADMGLAALCSVHGKVHIGKGAPNEAPPSEMIASRN